MVRVDVLLRPLDQLVVALAVNHLAASAVDHSSHHSSSGRLRASSATPAAGTLARRWSPHPTSLLSKLRHALGPEMVVGREDPRLELPADSYVDLEFAYEKIHEAEPAVRLGGAENEGRAAAPG